MALYRSQPMRQTVLSEFSSLLLTIYRHAQDMPVQRFQDEILEVIKPHLPFDSSMWGTATMTDGGIDIHSIHLHNFSQETLAAYEKVKHQDSAAARVTSQPSATVGFNALTEFAGPDQQDIRRFASEFGHNHFFITCDLSPLTRFAQWISLFRADPTQSCKDTETEFLANLAPHLMQALAINRLVHLDRLTGDLAREKWAVAIADVRGVIYHADKRFRELVALDWPGVAGEDRLPQELLQSLLGDDARLAGQRVVVQRSLEHGLLFLKARERHEVDSLSTREFMIARLLASGLTQKQVAARLERSPETVRSQTKVIFEKLRINNVTMLAPLLVLRE